MSPRTLARPDFWVGGDLLKCLVASSLFLNGPMQLAQQQLRKSLKAVRKLRRSVLLGVSCTLATSLEYSRIGGLQLSCELVDRNMGR